MNGNNAVLNINNGVICVINAIIRIDGGLFKFRGWQGMKGFHPRERMEPFSLF